MSGIVESYSIKAVFYGEKGDGQMRGNDEGG